MKVIRLGIALSLLSPFMAVAQDGPRSGPVGFVGLERNGGAWYFTSPSGEPFLSRGVCVVRERDDSVRPGFPGYDGAKKAGSVEAWAGAAAASLKSWNVDTVACWSSPSMRGRGLYTVEILNIRIERDKKIKDVFSPYFEGEAAALAEKVCLGRRGDSELLGYFLENEQPWWGDYGWYTGHAPTLLDAYMDMKADTPGKRAALAYYRGAYADIDALNAAYRSSFGSWKDFGRGGVPSLPSEALNADRNSFAGIVARRYYGVTVAAVKARDPDHLVLGDRFANYAPREVVKACGEFCDVVSLNYYSGYRKVNPEYLKGFAELSGRPLLITEFSYRAMENRSGDRNSKGADVSVATQRERAEGYECYVGSLARLPFILGWHWFQFFDQSPGGRSFDGEDSNYGLVDIENRPYEELTTAMRDVNAAAPAFHALSGSAVLGAAAFADEAVGLARGSERSGNPVRFPGIPPRAYGWADAENGGKMKISASGDALVADYSSGSGWGSGFSLEPSMEGSARMGYADLSAFEGIELALSGPKGLRVSVFLTEAGADDPGKPEYRGAEGSDGESFSSEQFALPGGTSRLRVPFELFSLRPSFGNQNGNRRIDLKAVRSVEMHIAGGQGRGRLVLESCAAY
jgi:hypothetical protein